MFPGAGAHAGLWRDAHPATLTVAPYPGFRLTFEQAEQRESGRYRTWIGRNAELPGASFVGVATARGYDAVLLVPGTGQFNFHARDGAVLVEEVAASGRDCGIDDDAAAPFSAALGPGVHYAQAAGSGAASGGDFRATPPRALVAPRSVDVLFLYNAPALAAAAERSNDPLGYLDGYTRAALETCNLVLQQSQVDAFVWRHVGLVAAPAYPAQETIFEELMVVHPDGPLGAFVREVRAEYGADEVMMWVGPGARQGAAFGGATRQTPANAAFAVSILRLTAGTLIMAHEFAHNFGCQHDRANVTGGAPEGDGFWGYGLLWADPPPANRTTSGTVMAYADYLVPYFSNPAITLQVTAALERRTDGAVNLGTRTIGFPETDPRAANNVRVLTDHAEALATISAEKETVPVIFQHPHDENLFAGQTMTLAVSASGGGLTFQWSKDGAAIAGANQASFAKVVAPDDAGDYRVAVGNSRGNSTSRAARVQVAQAPVPAPAPAAVPAAGGGGGGGGALSVGATAALVLLLARRLRAGG
ncbi:MAG: hypothetical protein HY302_01030 [Opitutae bacterium]|nr:hypothetical protein [Opitutae bacterium]